MQLHRLAALLVAAAAAAPAAAQDPSFNPAISVILDGAYHDDGRERGFELREIEIVLSSAIDPYFDGVAAFAIADGEIEVEEAFVTTRALPAGLAVKAGKFLSDVGYVNAQHPHAWLFADRPLVSERLFGEHGLQDTGVQVAWVPATPLYTRFGVEALQGDDEANGPRLFTAFAKAAPDLGFDHALQAGVFGGRASGDARLWGADVVYKHDAGGAAGKGAFVAQAEYARRTRDLGVLTDTQDGYYAQAVYGFARRWSAGVRVDHVGRGDVQGSARRATVMVAWRPTEFSRLRLQFARADEALETGVRERFNQLFLQWQVSLGAHGAHAF